MNERFLDSERVSRFSHVESCPPDCDALDLPFWRDSFGLRRMEVAERFLGPSQAQRFAKILDRYLLDDEILDRLRDVVRFGKDGEFELLSPRRWTNRERVAQSTIRNQLEKWDREGKYPVGVVLTDEEFSRVSEFSKRIKFVSGSVLEDLEFLEHYFFGEKQSIKVFLATRQRV